MKQYNMLALGAPLLLSMTLAKPMVHQHFHQRDLELLRRDLVTATVIEETTTTIDVTVTVYGSPPEAQIKMAANVQPADNPDPKPTQTSSSVAQSSTANAQADPVAIQQEAIAKQQKNIDDQQAKNQAQIEANAKANANSNSQAPAQPATPEKQAPASSNPPTQSQPQQQQSPAAKPDTGTQGSSGTAPSGGSCGQVGGKCMASDVTIYDDQGIGSCGWQNDTTSEDYFALAANTFGAYTNDAPGPHKNAFCGRMAKIEVDGKQFDAMLTDKCPGCNGWSIDLSKSLWNKVTGNKSPDRMHNINWWFTSDEVFHGASG
ncbi:uncharacterized protein KY384_006976 [Bacidia gigantensis]|uniref:uncharacterized protein n=1 Tax=Bacidia gigantensis TaxID=2732470 RepID=UPI001D0440D9|nr:uncharacterized protein KY384_006976 [Bacidia gigantensis]KAG8528060.1 hypothetical protein KY384_006976 [Bacidia gigantensis]